MRIFLWGMMGSGKTQLSRYLVENIEKIHRFIDLDQEIEKNSGKTIKQLFADHGEELFRDWEHKVLEQQIHKYDNFIMATGGGTPYFHDNYELMYRSGLTIFLEAPIDLLASRLWKEKDSRPLLSNISSVDELKQFLSKLLDQRLGYYRMAHVYWDIQRPREELLEKLKIMLNCPGTNEAGS